MELTVLARGDGWAVVAKPAHVPVHDSKMVNCRETVVRQARRQLGDDVHPVHRLDRPASGCLLLALERSRVAPLHEALRAGHKRYLAFVRGHIRPEHWHPTVAERPLEKPGGQPRPARTRLTPVATCPEPRSSLVLAEPQTGRFHQIRRHLNDLTHPILGDSAHGDTRVNRWWRTERGLTRLGLHCLSLTLQLEGAERTVICPVPDDLREVWRALPWWEQALQAVPELDLVAR
jgi:tRNA pseudouridine65 synthase